MVGFFTLTLSVVAGVSLCAGLYQLLVARRRYAVHGLTVNAWFGVLAMLVGGYTLAAVFAYQAQTLSAEILASRFQMAMACLALPALLHFLGLYTEYLPAKPWRWAGGLVFGGLFLINAFSPFSLLYASATGLQFVDLPWGERLSYMAATPGPWAYVFFAAIAGVFVYGFYACRVMGRRGARMDAWILGVALGIFALTVTMDMVTSLRMWRGIYFSEFGFMALVFITGLRLVDEMQTTEGRLHQILAATHEGVWTINALNQTDYVNDRMAAMLGYEPREIIGRTIFDFMDAEVREECSRLLARRRSGIEERFDFCLLRKDGTDQWVSMWAAPILNRAGQYCGAIAMVSDLSERRAIRVELEHRELELQRAQHIARIGSWSWDTQTGKIILSNELMRLYGIPNGALMARLIICLIASFTQMMWIRFAPLPSVLWPQGAAKRLNFVFSCPVARCDTSWVKARWLRRMANW